MIFVQGAMLFIIGLLGANSCFSDDFPGTRIDVVGKVISVDENGAFEIEGHRRKFRLFGVELTKNFPEDEFVGQNISCLSVYSLEHTQAMGYSETVIPAECYFAGSLLRGDVKEVLLDIYAVKEICDLEASYLLGCEK